jgi:hypothetical protein
MDIGVNYRVLHRFNLAKLKAIISSLPPGAWNNNLFKPPSYLRAQSGIMLIYGQVWIAGGALVLKAPLAPIFTFATEYVPGIIIRAFLCRLPPGGEIIPHNDRHKDPRYDHAHRLFLIIQSVPEIEMVVGGEQLNVTDGDLIDYNNHRTHHVINKSSIDRIVIGMDVMNIANTRFLYLRDRLSTKNHLAATL